MHINLMNINRERLAIRGRSLFDLPEEKWQECNGSDGA